MCARVQRSHPAQGRSKRRLTRAPAARPVRRSQMVRCGALRLPDRRRATVNGSLLLCGPSSIFAGRLMSRPRRQAPPCLSGGRFRRARRGARASTGKGRGVFRAYRRGGAGWPGCIVVVEDARWRICGSSCLVAFGWLWELACCPEVWRGREPLRWEAAGASPGRRMLREQVMELLWPELDPRAAGANLRKAIHHARRALDGAEGPRVLTSRGRLVGLAPKVRSTLMSFSRRLPGRGGRAIRPTARPRCLCSGDGLLPEEPL